MGVIYKYDVPFGTNDASAFYSQGNNLNGTNMTQASGGGVTLDTHQIWGQPFNGKQNVDGDLTITHGNIEMGCGDVHIGNVTDNEGGEGGNLNVDRHTHTRTLEVDEGLDVGGNANIEGDIYAIGNLSSEGHLLVDNGAEIYGDTFTDSITSFYGSIDAIKSESITTDYLTVLKSATFFEVIIEKLKSIGGSIILSPADGFVCSEVERFTKTIYAKRNMSSTTTLTSQISTSVYAVCYRLYWIAETTDAAGNAITLDNQWQIGDFMMCQSFGLHEGVSNNVATKYYWCIVVGVGYVEATDSEPRKNYIEITTLGQTYFFDYSKYAPNDGGTIAIPLRSSLTFSDPGCKINPSAGDNIVHLGNAFSSGNRGNAIYISCVTSRDYGLTPPFIATYKSIRTYNLSSYRHSWISPNGNVLRGQFFAGTDDKAIDEIMKEMEETAQQQIDNLNQGHADQQKIISSLIVSSNAIRQRVTDNESKISQLQIDINGIETKVENYQTQNSTQIKQNSDSITLFANELEKLKVTKDKIILNGNTIVNGTVNINQDGTGFSLNGSGGEKFTIGSNNIGTYDSFAQSAANTWICSWSNIDSANCVISPNNTTSSTVRVSQSLGKFVAGQKIDVTNLTMYIMGTYAVYSTFNEVHIAVRKGSPTGSAIYPVGVNATGQSYQYDGTGWGGNKGPFMSSNITAADEYFLVVEISLKRTDSNHNSLNIDVDVEINAFISASTAAFGKLTYNGFGFNFGGGRVMFVGNDKAVIKYGTRDGFMIDATNGFRRMIPDKYTLGTNEASGFPINSNNWVPINTHVVRRANYDNSTWTGNRTIFATNASIYDDLIIVNYIPASKYMIIKLPKPNVCIGKEYIIKCTCANNGLYIYGGGEALVTTSGSSSRYIMSPANETLYDQNLTGNIAAVGGSSVRYYGLYSIQRLSMRFISDGAHWLAFYCG